MICILSFPSCHQIPSFWWCGPDYAGARLNVHYTGLSKQSWFHFHAFATSLLSISTKSRRMRGKLIVPGLKSNRKVGQKTRCLATPSFRNSRVWHKTLQDKKMYLQNSNYWALMVGLTSRACCCLLPNQHPPGFITLKT